VGEVTSWRGTESLGEKVDPGTTILELDWHGYHISDADELYHTVWDAVEGTASIQCPFPGSAIVEAINEAALDRACRAGDGGELDEDTWIARFSLDPTLAARITERRRGLPTLDGLMDAESYDAYVHEECEPPLFGDDGENEGGWCG
jgi:hypothetical protein